MDVRLEVGGEAKLVLDGKVETLKLNVAGRASYEERWLDLSTETNAPSRSLRHYDRMSASIQIGDAIVRPELRKDRNLLAVEDAAHELVYASPLGSITREELDLVSLPCDSLVLDRLLPGKNVAVGDTWRHDDALLARLLTIDAVGKQSVESKLEGVTKNLARCEIAGTVEGAVDGIATEIEVKGRYVADANSGRVVWMSLALREKRAVGHVGPGLEVTARTEVTVKPLGSPNILNDTLTAKRGNVVTPQLAELEFTSALSPFAFQYDRRWHVVADDVDQAVLRFIDRGELVAQCNLNRIEQPPGGEVTLDNFKASVVQVLGDKAAKVVSEDQRARSDGTVWYTVVVEGTHDKLPIRWVYHRVTAPSGVVAVAVFTLEQSLVERFGTADESLVRSLTLKAPQAETAGVPVERK